VIIPNIYSFIDDHEIEAYNIKHRLKSLCTVRYTGPYTHRNSVLSVDQSNGPHNVPTV